MRAIMAIGGYLGLGWNISFASSTLPPTRWRGVVAGFVVTTGAVSAVVVGNKPKGTVPFPFPSPTPPGIKGKLEGVIADASGISLTMTMRFGIVSGSLFTDGVGGCSTDLTRAGGAGGRPAGGGGIMDSRIQR